MPAKREAREPESNFGLKGKLDSRLRGNDSGG
jgi:hypothetical protein